MNAICNQCLESKVTLNTLECFVWLFLIKESLQAHISFQYLKFGYSEKRLSKNDFTGDYSHLNVVADQEVLPNQLNGHGGKFKLPKTQFERTARNHYKMVMLIQSMGSLRCV